MSALYDGGREGFLDGSIDWDTDDIRVALVSAAYTPNMATHRYVGDLGATIVARSSALGTKTVVAGVADAADLTFTGVSGSSPLVTQFVVYKYNASDAAARLIGLVTGGTGLPVQPNGGDVNIVWDNGSTKIFKL